MNNSTEHSNDAMMDAHQQGATQQDWNRHPYSTAPMVLVAIITYGILLASPSYLSDRYACMVMGIGPAIYMTGYLYLYPNSLRSSSGSLLTAVCLVAFFWLVAVGVTVASLLDGPF